MRLAVTLLVATVVAAAASDAASAAPAGDDLLVLTAGSAQLQRAPGRAGEFRLVLRDVSRSVTGFSDRPARVLGRQSLTSFVRGWDSAGFGRVPPNAALVVDAARSSGEVVVLELLRPKLGPGRTVTFGAKALGRRPGGVLQRIARGAHDPRTDRFGRVSLFIDPTGPPPLPPEAIGLDFVFTAPAGVTQGGSVTITNYPVNPGVDVAATQLAGVSVTGLGVALAATGAAPYNATVSMSVEGPNCATTPINGFAVVPAGGTGTVSVAQGPPQPISTGPLTLAIPPC
jgi:hypothetical protein